jgi:4-amino-4-deoxy-L-arabinose transferase-like glycosyltransferase
MMNRYLKIALVVFLLALGLGLRLYDLTDQPIDFHPTRQLRGALIARGMYYQMLPNVDPATRKLAIDFGNTTGQYEPSIIEKIVAYTYRLMGGENLWVSRIYTSLFWIIAGLALFDLARRMTSFGGALVALSYYLILPFAVQASRSFQPDPGMVMWIVLSVYFLYRWSEKQSWVWAILAGLSGGIGILTKVVAGYILAGAAISMVIYSLGFKRFWRSLQVWAMAILMVTPSVIYYTSREGRASQYFTGWTVSLSHLLVEPSFYVRWLNLVQSLMGLAPLILALVGVLISRPRSRILLVGLWAGYGIYGLFLPYQMYSHSYYHLQLVPIIALSLAPVAQLIIDRLAMQGKIWQGIALGIVLVALVFPAWVSIADMKKDNYRGEPAYWQAIAAQLPGDGKIIAVTQDYGYRLEYYGWRRVRLWPNIGEQNLASLRGVSKEFEAQFAKLTADKRYFLITAFAQLNNQPALKQYLSEHYPISAQGDGYLIYDLQNPIK